jgi:hypothetical protein
MNWGTGRTRSTRRSSRWIRTSWKSGSITAGTAADLGMEWALEGTVHGSSAAFQTAKIGDVYELIYGEPMPSPDENDEDEDDEGEV